MFSRGLVCKASKALFDGIAINSIRNTGMRYLYTESALGIDSFLKSRERIRTQFHDIGDRFRERMKQYSEPESTNMIFTEDLKNMIHMAESNNSDVELVIKMLRRFNAQNKELRFGSFIFGPVIMRMFYVANMSNEALTVFKDPELTDLFDQLISYQLLLDLLFKNELYQEVIDTFFLIQEKQLQNARFPKNVVILTFAACYKLNSAESFKVAMDVWKQLREVGHDPKMRATCFAAALAINQNAPHIALEILSVILQQNYVSIRNLKVAALADIGRLEDILPILRSILQVDDPTKRNQTINSDVMEKLKQAIERGTTKEITFELQQLQKRLIDHGHVSQKTINDFLCTEISPLERDIKPSHDKRYIAANFSQEPWRRPRQPQRTGLTDMQ